MSFSFDTPIKKAKLKKKLKGKKKLFSFRKDGAPVKAADPLGSTRAQVIRDEADLPPYYVRGRPAGSRDEYWVSLALEKIEEQTGWTWSYQVPFNGGRRRRGGNVVDFLVNTPGMKTILDPMGRVWHTGANEDRQEMRSLARERNMRLIAWFTDETPTKEATYQYLRQEFHI